MDAFYTSVEQRDRPELRGLPVIVGADPRGRGVVAAASYEARRFGVHSAMPISRAARLCPQGVFLPVDMTKYARVSDQIMAILAAFSPLVEPISVDEAFLDVTGTRRLFGRPRAVAEAIKGRIQEQTGLVASAGVATNKFVAKVASDLEKPDGLVEVPPGREAAFLAPLPIRRLWGVGAVTARELGGLGVETIGQLASMPVTTLERAFGAVGRHLHDLAHGRDDRAVDPSAPPKSMGAEMTFDLDHRDRERLRRVLRQQAERVARELRQHYFVGARVTLKLRFADFKTLTRSRSGDPTQDGLDIFYRAAELLDRVELTQPVRLIGLSVSVLGPAARGQLALLPPDVLRREALARAVDRLNARFGTDSLKPASLLSPLDRRDR
jgi:DNA polymerase IV